eukprot:gene5699-6583_t
MNRVNQFKWVGVCAASLGLLVATPICKPLFGTVFGVYRDDELRMNQLLTQIANQDSEVLSPRTRGYDETGMKKFKVPVSSSSQAPFDVAVVVSFGYFIPKTVLSTFRYGGINMHPSLLPRHRGAAPLYHTMLNGDKETGVSIIKLDPKRFDTGDILLQTKRTMASIGAKCVLETLAKLPTLWSKATPQGNEGATHAPKVNKTQSRIDWSQHSRATIWNILRLAEILDPSTVEMTPSFIHDTKHLVDNKAGTYFIDARRTGCDYAQVMWIKCSDGWLGVTRVHEESKKSPVTTTEFFFGKGVLCPVNNTTIPEDQVVV